MHKNSLNNLKNIKNLLEKVSKLDKGKDVEKNIFSIGAKGYYENPTSDILAFFCNPDEEHHLGSLVLEALFNCLPKEKYSSCNFSLLYPPKREVFTKTQKKIDLLLEGEDWVIILENKIYHSSNNPFQEYRTFIESNINLKDKQHIYVILSPHGKDSSDGIWQGIKYYNLINEIHKKLATFPTEQPFNKWIILLQEFTLYLERLMSKPSLPEETINFVLNNLQQIKETEKLRDKAIQEYHKRIQHDLQMQIKDQTVDIKLNYWWGRHGLALRFFYTEWESNSNIVLTLDTRESITQYWIFYYAHNIRNDKEQKSADDILKENDNTSQPKMEFKTIRRYTIKLTNNDYNNIIAKIAHKLNIMNTFETNRSNDVKSSL